MRSISHIRQHSVAVFIVCSLLLSGCGVYSKVPSVTPQAQEWEGPLLDRADMEHVHIVVKPREKTIVLNLDELDADLSLLSTYIDTKENQHTLPVSDRGEYVLVIQKQQEID
ncbi:hypothetical protein [Sphaerochaeta globosa]|uniref:Lipoprotein n=1 Tax=Sphaerochaeta globosa (strain ATCC BAA-1886 / DSM 22777 / Buddy) TaxID=158189 RepID=F0RW91_SPHGB|nr:hypothetical protein [Sphaerochaeta globosa]ADY13448.1 hypothetical protein SpiBuddy_1623 [Sphaerochaeta globosa str. Buddy]